MCIYIQTGICICHLTHTFDIAIGRVALPWSDAYVYVHMNAHVYVTSRTPVTLHLGEWPFLEMMRMCMYIQTGICKCHLTHTFDIAFWAKGSRNNYVVCTSHDVGRWLMNLSRSHA
jgi:hypothetical protein